MSADRNRPWDGAATRQEEEDLGQQEKQNPTMAGGPYLSSDAAVPTRPSLPSPAPRLGHHRAVVALT